MRLLSFEAENFRNIETCKLFFSDGVNLLYGENAQGKTNALEAIYFFARGRSFRTSDEKELTKFGKDGFCMSIDFLDANGEQRMEYASYGREKRRIRNGVRLSRASEMIGNFRAVLFTPDDLGMVKDGPEERRAFLNVAISQCYPAYIGLYARYKTLLESRNALLRAAKRGEHADRDEIAAFSEEMAESAAEIRAFRSEYVSLLDRCTSPFLSEISEDKEKLRIIYHSDVPDEFTKKEEARGIYRDLFSSSLDREIGAGTSLFGVQRDDLTFLINDRSARDYGSQGQQRSVVLSLKLGEGEAVRQITGEDPVFLFDDVMSELDERRRSYLLTAVKNRQILMTCCELQDDFLRDLPKKINLYEVKNGEYSHKGQVNVP